MPLRQLLPDTTGLSTAEITAQAAELRVEYVFLCIFYVTLGFMSYVRILGEQRMGLTSRPFGYSMSCIPSFRCLGA